MDLKLRNDQRGAIIGRTGTGKSFLAKRLLPRSGNLAIIDPKREFDFDTCVVYNAVDKIIKAKSKRFIYRPDPDRLTDLTEYDKLYKYCYEMGNITVYTDDMVGIMDRQRFPHFLQVCYQMGRSKKVSMLSAFQRPAWLPMFLMSEANKFYVFSLNQKADIKKVNDMVNGYNPERFKSAKTVADKLHTFFYFSDRETASAIPLRLEVGRVKE